MNSLLSKLQLCGLPTTTRLLIGISGGRDSVALVHLLLAAGYRRLLLCHVNHRLRGRAATADERFVRRLAEKLGLPCHVGAFDVGALAKERGESVETAARHVRYAFFAQVARKTRTSVLVLGHHANDQVETLLFNLFRGSGLQGLGGMGVDSTRLVYPSLTPSGRSKPVSLRILRPLLGIWREEIDAYVAELRLAYREDESNASLHHTRNRIRHEMLPLARQIFGRDVAKNLLRTASILRDEDALLQDLARAAAGQIFCKKLPITKDDSIGDNHPCNRLCIVSLINYSPAIQRRVIRSWLYDSKIPDIGHREVELVRSLLEMKHARVNLPGNWHARRRAGELFLEKGSQKAPRL